MSLWYMYISDQSLLFRRLSNHFNYPFHIKITHPINLFLKVGLNEKGKLLLEKDVNIGACYFKLNISFVTVLKLCALRWLNIVKQL